MNGWLRSDSEVNRGRHLLKKWMKIILSVILVIVLIVLAVFTVYGPAYSRFMASSVVQVDSLLTVWMGDGGNSLILRDGSGDEVLVVDSKMGKGSVKIRAFVDSVASGARVTVVNTHIHADHTGGNHLFGEARFITGVHDEAEWDKAARLDRPPDDRLAVGEERILKWGDETVHIVNMGRAHSYNDVIVYLENRRLIATGDILFHGSHPVLIRAGGSHVGKWVAVLDTLLERYDIRRVVPGHGALSDRTALSEARRYFSSISEALGNEAELKKLKRAYVHYQSIPFVMTFNHTKRFVESEESREQDR